jgi:hydroxymethylpyrimidine pyrophosphatase-like HAD family hydrolase
VYYDSRCMSPELGNSVSNFKSLNCSVPDMPERPEDSDVVFDKFFCLLRPDDPVNKLRSFIGDEFTAVPQGEHYLEIVPTGCSKAEGIHILQKKLGIPKDNCYAIGDSENDIPMLEAVPHSIAMGVCSKTILPYCSYRTTPVLEDGIANALKHYGLI